ncbi:MAG: glycosyl transferase family 1 [Nitrospirales bacterium]|nr:MAG: glycosyl transferase family 1 [Nitrospirales bacterium]
MKIVIAAWHLKDFNVGLGRYTRNLIESLGHVDRTNDYKILIPVKPVNFPSYPNVEYRFCRYPVFKRRFWEQAATMCGGRYDLLHFPYDSCLAVKRGKFIVTIHDVKPLLYPKPTKHFNLYGYMQRLCIPRPLENIDHIITVSECSRRDIVEHLGVPQEQITVIPQGVEHGLFLPSTTEVTHEQESSPYVLCVAGSDPTKNIQSLIHAFSLLPEDIRQSHQLILVGDINKHGELPRLVKQKGIEPQTVFAGPVSDRQLVQYYQQASLFVFPSLYEGFGLPVLEAMACGCPVVCSNTSSLPEVVGDAAMMVSPLDSADLEHAMRQVLTDPSLQARMRNAGLQRAQQFSWEQTAVQTVQLYEHVAGS